MASLIKIITKRGAKENRSTSVNNMPTRKDGSSKVDAICLDDEGDDVVVVEQPVPCSKCKKPRQSTTANKTKNTCCCANEVKKRTQFVKPSIPNSPKSTTIKDTESRKSKPYKKPDLRKRRLMKEYSEIMQQPDKTLFTIELVDENLYDWNINLFKVDNESVLHRSMIENKIKKIILNISFPESFPFDPPFLRVVYPRIQGGFIMTGGAICMELLTQEGWSSAYQVEAIIHQFCALVVKGNGRIVDKNRGPFSKKDAVASFQNLVKTHKKYGWVTPPSAEG